MELLVGSYTSGSNRGAGISSFDIADDGLLGQRKLRADVADPSFMALAADGVSVVSEGEQGRVLVFQRDFHDGSLALVSQSPVIGSDPCHLSLLPGGQVIVANYSSGTVSLLAPQRALEIQCTLQLKGSGPVSDRQEGPHAHQTVPTPYGTVFVSDLGSDSVLELRPHSTGLIEEGRLQLPAGTGPRHLVLRRSDSVDHLLVMGELDGHLHVFSRARCEAAGGWQHRGRVALFTRESVGNSYPAHIELSVDGTLAYASIRGQDQISVFRLNILAEDGLPELVQEIPTEGAWPRHFALRAGVMGAGVLYAANQKGNSITVFALQPDGLLGAKLQEVSIGTPACLVIS